MHNLWRFQRDDIMLILDYFSDFRQGYVVQKAENFETLCKKSNIATRAPFEEACLLAAEIHARVCVCGLDGMLVEECYGMNAKPARTLEEISHDRHIIITDVWRRINRVMWFCVGRRRRHISYQEWCRQTKSYPTYRPKNNFCDGGFDKPPLVMVS